MKIFPLKDVPLSRMSKSLLDELSASLPSDGIEVGAWGKVPVGFVFRHLDSKYCVSCVVDSEVVGLTGFLLWWVMMKRKEY